MPHLNSNEMTDEIQKRLSYKLPHLDKHYKPLKVSVTDMKNKDRQVFKSPELFVIPKFMQIESPLEASEVGTVMHKVLEKIDFNMSSDSNTVSAFLDGLCEKHFLTLKEREAIATHAIQLILESELSVRIRKAKRVYRETPFVLEKDGQFIQGIIDLHFEDALGWVLVDYKTDRIVGNDVEQVASRYAVQIALYKEAMERIIGKPVVQAMIYFIDANLLYQIRD
jgi:ATP-dependent helicase/nuclease subunit A